MIDGHEVCRGEQDVLKRKIKQLEEMLNKWSNHQDYCHAAQDTTRPCTCGYYKAMDKYQKEK